MFLLQVKDIRDNYNKEEKMDKEFIIIAMETLMKVNGNNSNFRKDDLKHGFGLYNYQNS